MNNPIKVYKASAGAGKTYTLVYEYIKYLYTAALCIGEEHKSNGLQLKKNVHRSILAVTFTNKSTAEMKERIVKALDKLARGEEKDYIDRLKRDIWNGVTDDETEATISRVATKLLTDILQDYSSFRVSTIDGFFQQVVRAFARELNLDNQYQVELDNETIMEMAVDNMLASLGEKGKETLLKNLTEFASEKVDDAKMWNPRADIIELSKLVTSEAYLAQKEHLSFDQEKLMNYRRRVKAVVNDFESKVKGICEAANVELNSVSNNEDVFAKTTLSGFDYEYKKSKKFELTASFEKLTESSEVKNWVKGKHKKDNSYEPVVTKLYGYACDLVDMLNKEGDAWIEYQTAQIVYSHLYILGILNEIDENAMEICRSRDCMIISSTTDFLNKIIENSDTPFIYEKVGVMTDHFMIDEFQDTSRLQWANFVPLLQDSVAQGHESMIVGDVKQSIYRWRNGDWKILHKGVKDVFKQLVGDETLEYNFRSAREVIEFNNYLYKELPIALDANIAEQFKGAMKFGEIYDSEQKINPKNKKTGYVKLRFIDEEEENENKSWTERSLDAMVEQMKMLDSHNGVAVLVRTNKEAQIIADRLKTEKIPFYSSEALCVADNEAVKLIESVLRYIIQPYEAVYRANFMTLYNKVCKGKKITAEDFGMLSYRGDIAEWEREVLRDENLTKEENEKRCKEFDNMKSYPLQRMIQTIEKLLRLSELDGGYHKVYVQSLIDKVHEYTINNSADVKSFLDYWSENGQKTYISMPEGDEAVRIITIFKSKGLEFGVVFIPFVDWNMGISKFFNIKLVDTSGYENKGKLFEDEIPVLPVNTRSGKKLLNSRFRDEIEEEYLDSCLDNLNLLYVATTRAEQQLYINFKVNKPTKTEKDSTSIDPISVSELVYGVMINNSAIAKSEDDMVMEYGGCPDGESRFVQPEPKEEKKNEEGIESRELTVDEATRASEEQIDTRAQLRYKYSEAGEIVDLSARRKGVRMHKLFERIITTDDVEVAVKSLVRDGDIREDEIEEIREKVDRVMSIEGVSEWFNKKWQVLNETELFVNNGEDIYRPDRVVIDEKEKKAVVIDYKFGEHTEDLHKRYMNQVKRYTNAISEMGYDVKGYLLYAHEDRVVEVN